MVRLTFPEIQLVGAPKCRAAERSTKVPPWIARLALLLFTLFTTGLCDAQQASRNPEDVRLHELQLIGTHNSYHLEPHPAVGDLIRTAGTSLLEAIQYTHRPLPQQLKDLQVRQLELDIYADPAGGLFAAPIGRKIVTAAGLDAGPDPNADGQLNAPGFKILHAPGFDYLSNVATLSQAFQQIRAWSEAHPRHLPVMVLLELKDSAPGPTGIRVVPYDRSLLQQLNELILQHFPAHTRLVPQELCSAEDACIRDAVLRRGWPTVRDLRGKVFFCLDNEGQWPERYLGACESPRQALLFVSVAAEHPQAAWMKRNDPEQQFQEIQSLVRQHFLVRTRADADTRQSRSNNGGRRDQAMSSGAQYISTDFPEPQTRFSDYSVRWPDQQPARYNPLFSAPPASGTRWE